MYRRKMVVSLLLTGCMLAAMPLQGCAGEKSSSKTEIEIVQYKPEAVEVFEQLEQEFNETHEEIHLTIESPIVTKTTA